MLYHLRIKWVINGTVAMTSYVLGVGQPTPTIAEQMAEGLMCTSTNVMPAGLAKAKENLKIKCVCGRSLEDSVTEPEPSIL